MNNPSAVTRLGIIGDVHAEDDRLKAAIDMLLQKNVDAIVCTGDIVDGTGCPDTCITLLKEFNILTVRGNHDRWILEDKARHIPNAHALEDRHNDTLDYLTNLPLNLEVDTIKGKLMVCHGIEDDDLRKVWPGTERMAVERSLKLDRLIHETNYRYVINGHMHFRTLIHFEALTLINAGTLKGEHWPGFSLIDFEQYRIEAFGFEADGTRRVTPRLLTSRLLDQAHYDVFRDTQAFNGGWNPVRLF